MLVERTMASLVPVLVMGASYYAAFALDPDGHNVEAVVGGVG